MDACRAKAEREPDDVVALSTPDVDDHVWLAGDEKLGHACEFLFVTSDDLRQRLPAARHVRETHARERTGAHGLAELARDVSHVSVPLSVTPVAEALCRPGGDREGNVLRALLQGHEERHCFMLRRSEARRNAPDPTGGGLNVPCVVREQAAKAARSCGSTAALRLQGVSRSVDSCGS